MDQDLFWAPWLLVWTLHLLLRLWGLCSVSPWVLLSASVLALSWLSALAASWPGMWLCASCGLRHHLLPSRSEGTPTSRRPSWPRSLLARLWHAAPHHIPASSGRPPSLQTARGPPTRPQEDPKRTPRGPTRTPRGPQEDLKRTHEDPKNPTRT